VRLDDVVKGPLLGGPQRVNLGRFLDEYAYRVSIAKHSLALAGWVLLLFQNLTFKHFNERNSVRGT
jgi:hypothetical protein